MKLPEIFYNAPFVWFLIGLILAVLEIIIPGFVIIFFAFGAWLVALLSLILDMGVAVQITLFITASVLSLVFLRKSLKSRFFSVGGDASNPEDDEFIGQQVLVTEDILPNMEGKVEFKGANWSARSETAVSKGSMVQVTGKESICLIVKPL